MKPIQILICGRHAGMSASLIKMLEREPYLELTAVCTDGKEAVARAVRLRPQVVLMDTDISGLSGAEAIRRIKTHLPQVHILMYTYAEDEDSLFSSLCAGAGGYLLKTGTLAQLAGAIREIVEGGSPMSPSIARKVIHYFHQQNLPDYTLCERELGILRLLVQGLPIKSIAGQVHLSIDGVKKNLANIYHKMDVSCGKEAVAKAIREQVVQYHYT